MNSLKLSVRDIAFLGLALAILEISKVAFDFLPNVELVTLLFIVYTISFGRKTILVALGFVGIECAIKGVSIWVLMYLYVWPLLIMIVDIAKRRNRGHIFYCILSGLFGLFFGAFCIVPYLITGGPIMAYTWWIAGIPYDIIHGVSNFIICLVLFRPLCTALKRIYR